MRMTRIRPPSSCRPVVNVLESLSLRIGYAKRMLVAVTASYCQSLAVNLALSVTVHYVVPRLAQQDSNLLVLVVFISPP
jgi:hypothetical protein